MYAAARDEIPVVHMSTRTEVSVERTTPHFSHSMRRRIARFIALVTIGLLGLILGADLARAQDACPGAVVPITSTGAQTLGSAWAPRADRRCSCTGGAS